MYISYALLATVAASAQLVSATPAGNPEQVRPRADASACAKAASAAASYAQAFPTADQVKIPAEVAYDCLKSVPFVKDPAAELTKSLHSYLQLHSILDYLRTPPSGYLHDAFDMPKALAAIETKVLSKDPYESEYDFQIDLKSLWIKGKDEHGGFNGDLITTFGWRRPLDVFLVSLSADGQELPKVYNGHDILDFTDTGVTRKPDHSASAVKSINGMDVETFLLAEANQNLGQDPDNNWNGRFYSIQNYQADGTSGLFNRPPLYPGPTTVVEYQNGTKTTLTNEAVVRKSLEGITTGQDMYNKFCMTHPENETETNEKRDVENLHSFARRAEISFPEVYPKAVITDYSGVLAGYYLENSTDTAVLAINSFSPGTGDNYDFSSFQNAVAEFFAGAVKEGKTKLIIDLQGNGGGSLDLCIDLIAQMFPDSPPNSKDNLRASLGMHSIMIAASNYAAEGDRLDAQSDAEIDSVLVPFAYQEIMTPEVKNFPDLQAYYGPTQLKDGFYTNFFQGNYTNADPTEFGVAGVTITGYGNRTGFKQPFKAENIIMVTDGVCASACTIFSEHMKQKGVQVITLGGRPQTGPMQAVGGTKGSQVFQPGNLAWMIALFSNGTLNTDLPKAKGTVWENFNTLPIERSSSTVRVNGRNQYRIGDTTQTPLHFVYEAADCRMWYTPEMAASPVAIWDRVASLAFENRKDGVIDSPFCVKDSTKHPTSLSGGLKKGELGPQTPPSNAKSKVQGMLINGKDIVKGLASGKIDDNSPVDASIDTGDQKGSTSPDVLAAVETVVSVCKGYTGSEWFVELLCGALTKQNGGS